MTSAFRNLAGNENGGVVLEYALVLALVSLVSFTALQGFGDVLSAFFGTTSDDMAQVAVQAK